ncbi:iron ABC transporter permease [Oceanicella sp. SM1341]|uniref:FecCD family ABC transporter permease n=1 Tax=Oceanicella sp. SM1341 TaxID=1548889 RepID=UPI000E4BA80C|nr:iron ABC transporter permease [Oceanicella sp. SM1341]
MNRGQGREVAGVAGALGLCAAALCLLALWAMTVGSSDISVPQVARALFAAPEGRVELVVQGVRLPRVLAALGVGAALAVAGAIMQAVTGNPLAEPGLLGVNAGAAFAVVLAIALLGVTAAGSLLWAAFAGAAAAAVLVQALGSAGRSGPTPLKLVLAGVVIATFLGAVSAAVLILDARTFETMRLWTAGSLRGRQMAEVTAVLPWLGAGLGAALLVAGQFTALSLGADTARALGQNQPLWRLVSALLVVLLAGGAVALAGPLGFVGLVVPHIVRMSLGADYRRILPFCALGGAGLTLLADTLPRAAFDRDVPVGITLALVGAPFFIWLARTRIGGAPA